MSEKTKIVRTGDIIVFVVLGASALLMIWAGAGTPKTALDVEIVAGGEVAYRAPLSQNFRYEALGPLGQTTVVCQDGCVWVEGSCCPNKLCVKTGKARAAGQIIVCVPNEVVVRIVGAGQVDAIAM